MSGASIHFHVNVAQVIAFSGATVAMLYFLNCIDESAKRFNRPFVSEVTRLLKSSN